MMAIHCLLPATGNQCFPPNLLGRMPTTDTTCLASISTSVLVFTCGDSRSTQHPVLTTAPHGTPNHPSLMEALIACRTSNVSIIRRNQAHAIVSCMLMGTHTALEGLQQPLTRVLEATPAARLGAPALPPKHAAPLSMAA
jgi:hypothetical protein